MTQTLTVACVAIVAGDDSLMFIEKFEPETQEMEMDISIFTSIGSIGQKYPSKLQISRNDRFIAIQQTSDRFSIWGYRASLGYKVILITLVNPNPSEGYIKTLCERIKDALFDVILNPFYVPFSSVDTPSFHARIDEIVKSNVTNSE